MTEVPTPRQSLAFALWQLADLIQADERSRSFRARAYRSAVWSLDDLSDSMDDPPETVLAVPGLGKGVLRIIEEFRATSEIDELRRLSRLYPADSARLRQLPRMTPAILRGLKAELQIETVADLVTAIDRDDATVVRGVGEATAERWLSVVSTWPDHRSMPSFRAWSIAARVAEHFRRQMGAGAEVAGEVRRVTEWVGQIVVVVDPPDHARARSWLHRTSLGVTRSEDESTLILAPPWRLPLTIRLSTEQDWGTDLIEATGPEEHVARIRPAPGIATEEEVYQNAGLPWIPPPARSVLDPPADLITAEMIRGDLHIHTDSSPDGRMSLDDVVRMLADRGYEYALITDHTIGLRFGGLDGPGLRQQHELIEEFRAGSTGLRLLHGAEVNVGPSGDLDLDARTLEVLDFVVAGVHSNFDLPFEAQTERVVRALHHPSVRILSHPTGRRIGLRPPLRLDIEAVIEAAAANAVALEANGHRDRLDISAETARLAVDAGVLVAANSDAHRPDELSNVANAIATLQRAHVPARFVVNAMPWDDFARWAGLDIS